MHLVGIVKLDSNYEIRSMPPKTHVHVIAGRYDGDANLAIFDTVPVRLAHLMSQAVHFAK